MAAGRGGRCVTGGYWGVGARAEVVLVWFREGLVFGGGSYKECRVVVCKAGENVFGELSIGLKRLGVMAALRVLRAKHLRPLFGWSSTP